MASITIRKLEDSVKERLRIRAAKHGCSMEEEVRNIIKRSLATPEKSGKELWDSIRRLVEPHGGFDIPEVPRGPGRKPPTFE